MALYFFLSHPGFTKIGCNVRALALGKIWRDFGCLVEGCLDVSDVLQEDYGTMDLFDAHGALWPKNRCPTDSLHVAEDWNQSVYTKKMLDYAAFMAWGARQVV